MATRLGEVGQYEPSQDWDAYEGPFKFFIEAHKVTDAKQKRADLLCTIGATSYIVVVNINSPTELSEDSITFENLLKQLREFYGKKPSTLTARTEFARLKQREGQSVNNFALELRNQATRCNFGADLKTRLRDKFVVGVHSDAARKRLMEKDEIKIEDAEKFARDFERVDRENKAVSGEQSLTKL